MNKYALFFCAALAASSTSILAQQPAWQPAPGHLTLPLWPGVAPGAPANLPPEVDTTTAKDNLIAGRPIVRLGNVSSPTLTVYSSKGDNTGAAIVVFPAGAIASSPSISKALKSATGSTPLASPACW